MWGTQAGGNLSFATENTERLRVESVGTITRDGHLGNSYTNTDPYWIISTFNDNANVTSGSVTMSTLATEWATGDFLKFPQQVLAQVKVIPVLLFGM